MKRQTDKLKVDCFSPYWNRPQRTQSCKKKKKDLERTRNLFNLLESTHLKLCWCPLQKVENSNLKNVDRKICQVFSGSWNIVYFKFIKKAYNLNNVVRLTSFKFLLSLSFIFQAKTLLVEKTWIVELGESKLKSTRFYSFFVRTLFKIQFYAAVFYGILHRISPATFL